MIKSIISNLPTYFLSIFPLPTGVDNYIRGISEIYLCGGVDEKFKFYLVSWSKVCSPIPKGELRIRNLLLFNRALLGKWLWCYVHERGLTKGGSRF